MKWCWISATLLALAPAAAAQKPVSPPPVAADETFLSADYLLGMWSDQADCSGAIIDIRADGTFVNLDRSHGTWRLEGDRLTLTGSSTTTLRIMPRNNFELTIINADGSPGYSRRCNGPNRPSTQ